MLKKDGVIIEQYDYIKEYRLRDDGHLVMTSPSLEVREFGGAHSPILLAYLSGADRKTLRTRYYPDEFWDLQKCTQVFRFRADVPDAECRAQIAAELDRRAEETEKKLEYFQRRAATLRLQAKTIRQSKELDHQEH